MKLDFVVMDSIVTTSTRSKNASKTAQFVSAKDRVKISPTVLYEDGGKLFCKPCSQVVDHVRKSTIDDHLKSAKHRRQIERQVDEPAAKRQRTMTSLMAASTIAKTEKVAVVKSWVTMLTATNIPLSKTDHPKVREFLNSRVKNGGAIPGGFQLQNHYLPLLFTEHVEELKAKLKGKNLCVILDEMSDDAGRYVLNVLVSTMELNSAGRVDASLIDVVFMEKTNHSTVSMAIVKTLTSYDIEFEDVVAFDTDNASCMKKAFRDVLSPLFPNSIHVTCLAHIMNLVGESFRQPFEAVNNFVRRFNQQFYLAGGRKARFLSKLKSYVSALPEPEDGKKPLVTMAPNPVATRWGCWFDAVRYHVSFMKFYPAFLEEEMVESTQPPASVKDLVTLTRDSKQWHQLTIMIGFISEHCMRIMELNDHFQSRQPCALTAWDTLQSLLFYVQGHEMLSVADCPALNESEELSQDEKDTILSTFKAAYRLASEKITKYMTCTGQPAAEFLKQARVFLPRKASVMSPSVEEYPAIPGFSAVPAEEMRKYCTVPAPEVMFADANDDVPLGTFWRSVADQVPTLARLALRFINAVTNSADAERSFSLYN